MKKFIQLFTVIAFLFSATTVLGQGGWTQLSTNYIGNFKDVYFINTTVGYAVGGNNTTGIIYKTTNGGTSWSATAISTSSLESVWFTSSSTGFAVGSGGKIFTTTNAGSTWTVVTSPTTTGMKKIHFPTSTVGYAAGGSVMIKSTNSGSSWTSSTVPSIGGSNTIANGVFFTSSSVGYLYGSYNFFNGWINYTTNGGSTWSYAPFTSGGTINDIYFIPSTTTGFAVGNGGGIYKTTAGGTSWTMKTSGTTKNLNAVYFVSASIGYAVGDSGLVLKTVNGGTTWNQQQTSVTTTHFQGIYAPSLMVAYIAGDNNKIMKTSSGGVSISVNVSNADVYCNGYTNLHAYVSYNGTGTVSYTWNASPYLSSTTDSVVTAGPLTNDQTFIVTVSDGLISATDTVLVSVVPLPTDSICIVAIDSISNHPIIVFEKHISGPIKYYKIYRESNVAGIYDSIAFLPPDSAGVFMDTSSNVIVRQYSYKISNVDSCGNESMMSAEHKTMHLQVNAGAGTTWNLIWSKYEGVFVQSYEIWRGTDTINMALIGTVPGSNNSYTDLNPPSGGLYYVVKIVSAYICQPYNYKGKTSYNSSRSNRANNGLVNPPIAADFSATPLTGNSPLNVQFQDATTGLATTWKWYFGDGDTSNVQNPSHTYTTDGKYTVKLVVGSNTAEDSIEKVDFITVGGIGFEDIDIEKQLRIYPNPVQHNASLFIDYEQVEIVNVTLLNIVGERVEADVRRAPGQIELKTSGLSSGIYILKLQSSTGDALMRKVIIR